MLTDIKDFDESELANFTGTEAYHKVTLGNIKATDGIAYLCQKAGCFWLMDIIASVQHLPKIQEHLSFIVWRIIKNEDNGAIVSAYWDCEEDKSYSDTKLLYRQEIKYTDFPLKEFEFYQIEDVVLLKSEY